MAKADGVVTPDEEQAFARVFRVPPGEEANVRRIFNLARQGHRWLRVICGPDCAHVHSGNPGVKKDVMDEAVRDRQSRRLCCIPAELAFLERVAEIFGFAPQVFRRIRATHFRDAADPYVILGVSWEAGDDEIKRTYRMLVKENHPDSLMARGVPPEFEKIANDKLASINAAYEKILEERGIA